jgi:hypothetical protein
MSTKGAYITTTRVVTYAPPAIRVMLANGVQRIYTFNPGDFQVFAELTVVTPT